VAARHRMGQTSSEYRCRVGYSLGSTEPGALCRVRARASPEWVIFRTRRSAVAAMGPAHLTALRHWVDPRIGASGETVTCRPSGGPTEHEVLGTQANDDGAPKRALDGGQPGEHRSFYQRRASDVNSSVSSRLLRFTAEAGPARSRTSRRRSLMSSAASFPERPQGCTSWAAWGTQHRASRPME
jgi:hypothetical protein